MIPLSVRRGLSRARKLALQWARRARLEIRSRTGVQPEAVIYILCVGRSGSSLLDKSLGQQPGVRAHGELLHRVRFNADKENPQRTQRYLRRELLGHPERVHVVKVFQGHLDRSGIDIASLRRFGQRQVFVVLYREELGAQFISKELAKQTGRYRLQPGEAAPDPPSQLAVTMDAFDAHVAHTVRMYDLLLSDSSVAAQTLHMSYAMLVADPRGQLERIGSMAGFHVGNVRPPLQRQRQGSLHSRVTDVAVGDYLVSKRLHIDEHGARVLTVQRHLPTDPQGD